jgi:hypothetical protein
MGALGVTHEGELTEEVVEQQLAGGRDLLRVGRTGIGGKVKPCTGWYSSRVAWW